MNAICVRKTIDSKVIHLWRRLSSSVAIEDKGDVSDELFEIVGENESVKQNKSGLLQQHRNILHNKVPYNGPNSWIHTTEKYQRKIFARYGSESGVDPRICFPKKMDLNLQDVYEKQAEPHSIHDMVMKSRLEQRQKIDEINKREESIARNMEKLEQWKKDLQNKILKKEADALAAKQRKERLVEEVRRHFGYKVDPRDERFKEVLEQKEREEKKLQREAKRQAKEQKLMAKLSGNSA
ncbi:growth arrest and DNA damage-inducible proteins-interacting protein CRIF [Musca autumnalis]|uniref:growth arrest and DNA damage-inducible proteins-interacting protein CRIF n=1 Tax=Musca autumnalis TaxID=221902 RepID=UPI003CF63ACE